MKMIKGFVTIGQYVNNNPGTISPLGELSTWSSTYTKEKGEYKDSSIPGYSLITFKSIDTISGDLEAVDPSQALQALQLVKDAIAYATTHIRPYDSLDFKNTLLAAYSTRINNFNFGSFVDNGSLALPEWFSWNSIEHNGAYIKIWLSDQAFQDQYDEYEITVIPPIDVVDNFFGLYNVVVNTLSTRTLNDLSDRIEIIKGSDPETYLRILNFDFINTSNTSQKYSTNWAVLIYGKAGDNIDTIKDAIVDHVLANSTYTRQQWELILPDLFKRTEFVILPRWDKVSIPNLTVLSALYSSILDPKECLEFAKTNIDFYTEAFIEDNVRIFPYDYKAISLVCVNGESNIDNKKDILDIIPDYIPVPSTSTDFNRMQLTTKNWILKMDDLLIAAETATEFTSVPNQLRRIKRGDVLFLSVLYNNVNYLVAAKSNTFYDVGP